MTASDEANSAEDWLELSAERFLATLQSHRSADELAKIQRYFKMGKGEYAEGDVFIGVRMGQVFDIAKAFSAMPLGQIETLLDSPVHEARAGALRIMAQRAAAKRTPETVKKDLYDLYWRRMDRINNWDLVDLAARDVVGGYLVDKPRDQLYELARSPNLWARRTAIYATLKFIRAGDLDDAFAIATLLLDDPEDLIHKAAGGVVREAGRKDRHRLEAFLDKHAATMPRTMLRTAIEHFDKDQRSRYLARKRSR